MDSKKVKEFFQKKWNGIKEKEKPENKKHIPVLKVGRNRTFVIVLWCILIISVVFGVYNNLTAVDTETVYEREIVEERLTDTNAVESFVKKFARIYHSWGNTSAELTERKEEISAYLTEGTMKLNTDSITTDCPTTANVLEVDIWSLKEKENKEYEIRYSVVQNLTEGEVVKAIDCAYTVNVYVDDAGNMVITRNPTICGKPEKSSYAPEDKTADGSVDNVTAAEVEEFLNTFFALYPKATGKELSYYVKNGVLDVIQKDYVFSGLISPVYHKEEEQVKAYVYVKYLDQETKTTQISQYCLKLEKGDNWKIVEVE